MDRVIKFRVWDKEERRWRYSTDSDHVSYFWQFVENYLDHETHKTLTQFTGLLDKHGKEVYEGDIVLTENEQTTAWADEEMFKGVVTYIGVGYQIIQPHDEYKPSLQNITIRRIEVIGNVFEHSHLLTAQQ